MNRMFRVFIRNLSCGAGALALVLASGVATAADYSVSTYSELASALNKVISSNSTERTVIELAPGPYEKAFALYNRAPKAEVVLRSAKPSSPAIFERIKVNQSSNLTFDGIKFLAPYGKDTGHVRALEINGSTNIKIVNSSFEGDIVRAGEGKANLASNKALRREDAIEGFAIGNGIRTTRSENIEFSRNTMTSFRIGTQFIRIKGLIVEDNEIRETRMDAFNFAEVENARIVGNRVIGMTPWVGPGDQVNPSIGDHADMIQFWTDSTDEPSRNVLIANNYLSSPLRSDVDKSSVPASYYVQGIFIRNEKVDTGSWPTSKQYQGIKICGNYVATAHVHGITANDVNGLQVMYNHIHSIPFEGGYTAKANFKWLNKPAIRPTLTQNRLAGDINMQVDNSGGYIDVSEGASSTLRSIKGKILGDGGKQSPPRLTYDEFLDSYSKVHNACLGEIKVSSLY